MPACCPRIMSPRRSHDAQWLVDHARHLRGAVDLDRVFQTDRGAVMGPEPTRAPIQDAKAASEGRASERGRSTVSIPLAALRSREEAQAWLVRATAQERHAMAELLQEGSPTTPALAAVQEHFALAVCASEGLSRRLGHARRQNAHGSFRWRPLVSFEGTCE